VKKQKRVAGFIPKEKNTVGEQRRLGPVWERRRCISTVGGMDQHLKKERDAEEKKKKEWPLVLK